jgi:hypothetical protein
MRKLLLLQVYFILSLQFLFAQQAYEVVYSTHLYDDIVKLGITDDAFKISGAPYDYLKIKEDSENIYLISNDSAGKCSFTKHKISSELEFELFDYNPVDTLLKIDTIYHSQDTLINNFNCKKVEIRYILGGLVSISENQIVPIDTVKKTFWIDDRFKTWTPFSFNSSKINGLIIQSKTERVDGGYIDEFGNIKKNWISKFITTKIRMIMDDLDVYFSLPIDCNLIKSE